MLGLGPQHVALGIVALGLIAERSLVRTAWASRWPWLSLAGRWLWRTLVVAAMVILWQPPSLALYRSPSPSAAVDALAMTALFLGATLAFWWIGRPALPGSLVDVPLDKLAGAVGWVVALTEGFTRQALFAAARLSGTVGSQDVWLPTVVLLWAAALPVVVTGQPRRGDVALWTALVGGTALAVVTNSLWPAMLWDTAVLAVIGLGLQHQEVPQEHIGQDK